MSKQSQGSMIIVGAIAGGIGFVAFVALMVLGNFAFSPALFLAILVAAAASIFLLLGFHRTPAQGSSALTPEGIKPADLTSEPKAVVAPGTAGVQAGTAGVEPGSAGIKVKSGTLLAGEQELASRKGDWKYRSEADDAKAAPVAEPVAAAPAADNEEKSDGVEPTRLDGPRDGGADDLKQIKGVGPKLEEMLHRMGFYHFDQVAHWSAAEVAWVDENLEGFKGRVSRDDWVAQAKILASGAETEFSKKVEGGGVY